jgi:dienelactone hydrolase
VPGGLPSVGTAFGARGAYAVSVVRAAEHTFYHPSAMGTNGLRHPVILWGNGTGTTPSAYDALLRHWASHGFIVAAANTSNAGSGAEMLRGLDQLTALNATAGSPFQGKVDLSRVGASGHSQGGFGAVAAARDPRVRTAAPLQGGAYSVGSTASILFFAGQNDTIVSPTLVRSAYSRASRARAAYAELQGATHFEGAYNGGNFRAAATAWMRWQLADDTQAKALFTGATCGLCTAPTWVFERNAQFQSAWPR